MSAKCPDDRNAGKSLRGNEMVNYLGLGLGLGLGLELGLGYIKVKEEYYSCGCRN